MADFIAEKLNEELSYETPRIQEMTIPAGVVCGESGLGYGKESTEQYGEIPGEMLPDGQ